MVLFFYILFKFFISIQLTMHFAISLYLSRITWAGASNILITYYYTL